MAVTVETGESTIAVFYRFNLPGGPRLIIGAAPLDERTATRVLGNVTTDYALVIPIFPQGFPWPFMRGFRPQPEYVTQMTGVEGSPAALIARLIPKLVEIPPADELVEIVDLFLTTT